LPIDNPTAAVAITNLLATYAECIDTGNLDAAAELFAHAEIKVGLSVDTGLIDSHQLLQVWRDNIILYDDGTPRTKHVITNPNIDLDEGAGVATCRSYYTVFQQLDGFPLQPIIAGRYHDTFERIEGKWRWTFRDYTLVDLIGDLSRHLRREVRL
jgi:SnoaL-like domain